MQLRSVSREEAVGGVLVHNITDARGHKALKKGHRVIAGDVEKLRALGLTRVAVAFLDAGDVPENEAANRIARAVAGPHLAPSPVGTGRINLLAAAHGVLNVDDTLLTQVNSLEGITVATIPAHTVVAPDKMVATIKTIGLAVPRASLDALEDLTASGTVLELAPLKPLRVALLLTGSVQSRAAVERTFTPAIRGRVEDLGGELISAEYAAHEPDAIATALSHALGARADLVILAGETSIMDATDVTPEGIRAAGGSVELYGAPVEPGNLLLLAYAGQVPILGAPGCVRSRATNVVDLILPRLFAGEHLSKPDILALANGGLLL